MRLARHACAVLLLGALAACSSPPPARTAPPASLPATAAPATSAAPKATPSDETATPLPATETPRPRLDVRPLNGWFSVKFTCRYGSASLQKKWADIRAKQAKYPQPPPERPAGWYDANALHGAARLAVFNIWSHLGSQYVMREKATSFKNGVAYTLSRELPNDAYPWSKNLVKSVVALDGFMQGGGCVYERAPVLRDWFRDSLG